MKTNKLIKTVCIVACLLYAPMNVQAQFWKKVSKRLQDKVENKAMNKIDKKADETIDGALKNKNKKKKTTSANTKYSFKGSVTVEVSNEKNDKTVFNLLFNRREDVICMEMNVDGTNQIYNVITPSKIISLINADGMKIKKESESIEFDNSDRMPQGEEGLIKTGNTKTILGYNCEEYQYKNEEGSASIWVTSRFPIKSNYAPLLGMTNNTNIKGFVLELNYESKSGEKGLVQVIKIEKDKKQEINTADYKSMF
ncbi:DUF4412 domain-containing protein [uncultured Tenacibaculum sp.]|uniref:DUF4412 domain-containing protein n=1 Tax=uncultured Tenacibaculum sp. TaxID=174713 RepID=UPI002616600E|nr:DUF4412 domain-containing protein [uncultured Tenacibaculum sp.]